jgi:glycosyltransferase involved in cell wall biosynthesis
MPMASVVLPVFNAERYVSEAVWSILRQSFEDLELVVIDDGSTDRSPEIISGFQDTRMVVLLHESNLGIVPSLNDGIRLAKGKYVCRMDADDVADLSRLKKQMAFMEEHATVAVLGCDTEIIDEMGMSIRRERYPQTYGEIRRTIFTHNPFAHSSVVVRRSVLEECGGYTAEYLHNEDYDLWLRVCASHEAANLSETLMKRREHREAITTRRHAELVRHRVRVIAHAALKYYHRPQYLLYTIRPGFAAVYWSLRTWGVT